MISCIWFELKALIKKPKLFLLLLSGMVIGSFALVTYYVAGTQDLQQLDTVFEQKKVVEFRAFSDSLDGEKLLALIENEELPSVKYAAVSVYNNSDYDIFAVYYSDEFDSNFSGRYIHASDMGLANCVVTYGLKDKRININGTEFDIVGVMAENGFAPDSYDFRRIPNGEEYVAGVELARDPMLSSRPEDAVIIPLDMLDDVNIYPDYYHILFRKNITESDLEQIKSVLTETFGKEYIEFTDMTAYSEIHSSVKYIRLLIYSLAVFIGIINVVAVFGYFLRSNKKSYALYKMLGANNTDITVIIIGELFIICFISFVLGSILSYLFTEYSGLVSEHLPVRPVEILLLFAVFFVIVLLLGIKQIRSIVRGNTAALLSDNKQEKDRDGSIDTANRHLYLFSFNYGKSTLGGTFSLIFLSFACAFTLAFAMNYVIEGKMYGRYVSNVFDNSIGVLCLKESEFEDRLIEAEADNDKSILVELRDRIINLTGVKGIGESTFLPFFVKDDSDNFYPMHLGSDVFWDNSQYPLQKGSWEKIITYSGQDTVPIVVDYRMGKQYPVGSRLTLQVATEYRDVIEGYDDDGHPYGHAYETYAPFEFEVVGVLKEDVFEIEPNSEYQLEARIDHYLGRTGDVYDSSYFGSIYAPYFTVNGESPVFTGEFDRKWYVFSDGDTDKYSEEWNEELSDIGKIDTFKTAVKYYEENYRQGGGNTYFMHAFISALLLIFGIGGYTIISFFALQRSYGIYFLCGMPWSYGIKLLMAANCANVLVPSIIGAFSGSIFSDSLRNFSISSKLISIGYTLLIMLIIYIFVSVILINYLNKKTPKSLISEEK